MTTTLVRHRKPKASCPLLLSYFPSADWMSLMFLVKSFGLATLWQRALGPNPMLWWCECCLNNYMIQLANQGILRGLEGFWRWGSPYTTSRMSDFGRIPIGSLLCGMPWHCVYLPTLPTLLEERCSPSFWTLLIFHSLSCLDSWTFSAPAMLQSRSCEKGKKVARACKKEPYYQL